MKKLFVLLVLVVAMVAAPLFAEVSFGSWGGDFQYKIGGNFQNAAIDRTLYDLDLGLTASIGEFTTFSTGFSGSETKAYSGTDGDEIALVFSSIEMTQDFSSFIGNDITLKMTVGNFNREVTEYEIIGETDAIDGVTDNAVMLTFGVADLTAYAWVAPVAAVNGSAGTFVFEAVYSTDMVSANVAFLNKGTAKGVVEGGLKVAVADATVAAMVQQDLDAETTMVNAGASYAMAPITVEVEFMTEALEDVDTNGYVVAGVAFAATDVVTLKAGATIPFDGDMGFDGGVVVMVDSVAYTLGASYMGSAYMAPYSSADCGTEDFAVSFMMDVDF